MGRSLGRPLYRRRTGVCLFDTVTLSADALESRFPCGSSSNLAAVSPPRARPPPWDTIATAGMISAATIPTTLIYSRFRGNGTTLFSRLEDRISCVKGAASSQPRATPEECRQIHWLSAKGRDSVVDRWDWQRRSNLDRSAMRRRRYREEFRI
jgi:hypothetical protein